MKHLMIASICWLFPFFISSALIQAQDSDEAQSLSAVAHVQAPAVRFDHLSVEDGLSHSTVFAVMQDRLGFLWFGTAEGLNKYDGYRFTVYKPDPDNPNSLSDSYISLVQEDRAGHLWIGTKNGGLHKFDPATETFTRYRHDPDNPRSISENSIGFNKSWYEDAQGNLWIGTWSGGLNKFDPRTEIFTRYQHDPNNPNSLSHNTVHAITPASPETRTGKIWIGTIDGLNLFDPESETFIRYYHRPEDPSSLSHNGVTAVYVAPRPEQAPLVWVAAMDGKLNRFDPASQTFHPYPISQNIIENILSAADGTLWVATLGKGLFRFDPQQKILHQYRREENMTTGLNSDLLSALYYDRTGTLWISTHTSGVNRYDPQHQKFYLYQHHAADTRSLSAPSVFTLHYDRAGYLWIGTQGGGLNRLNPRSGELTHYPQDSARPGSLSHNLIGSVYEDRQGTLWVGTFGGGLNKFDPAAGTFRAYLHDSSDPHSLPENNVSAIIEDRFGALWVGTLYGGVGIFDHERETFSIYRNDPGDPDSLISNTIRSFFEDRAGNLWICTEQGLDRFDRDLNRFVHYRHDERNPHSLSHNLVGRVYEDRAGTMWVTSGIGLNRFDPQTGNFSHYFEKNGLPHNRVNSIIEDDQGYLWLGTAGGLSRFDPRTETFRNYDVHDGLQGSLFYYAAAAKDAEGRLYFGGSNGLNSFHPAQLPENPNIPPVVLTNFQLFNQDASIGADSPLQRHISLTDAVTLTPDQGIFTFEFAALNFTAPEKNRYAYMMAGLDHDWVLTTSSRRFATYTRLAPGTYTFRVKASNNDGVWNEQGASVKVIILPPWWATWWFRASLLAMLVGLTWQGYRWRVRTIQQRNQELETQVQMRTKELSESLQASADIMRAIPSGLFIYQYQPEDRLILLDANQEAERLTGITANTWRGKEFNEIWPQARELKLTTAFLEVFNTGRIFETEGVEYADGRVSGAYRTRAFLMPGKRLGVAFEDVTARKRAEDALRESEERFRMAFEHASIGMCLVGLDGCFLQVNSQMCVIFGYSQEEFARKTVNDITHPDYLDVSPTFIERARSGEVTHATFEKLYRHKEGRLVWGQVASALLYDRDGKPAYFISHVQDITERKRAEEAVRTSEERFAAVMNSMEAIMYVADMDTYAILFINQYTRKLFGDVEGQICWQVLQAGQTGPCAFCTNAFLVKDGQPTGAYHWEFQNTATGRWYHIQDQAIRWIDGRLVRLEIATDISRLKEVEEALRQTTQAAEEARQAAEAANQAKSVFLSNMSHELRTPLNAILGFAQLMANNVNIPTEEQEYLAIIQRSGEHLLTLINQVLDLAKIESGHLTFDEKSFDLHRFLEDLEDMFSLKSRSKGLHLFVTHSENVPQFIVADEVKLRQVLINLLNNAIKFTETGKVTLQVRSEGFRPLERAKALTANLQFSITDTGPGIAPQDQPRLFQAFQQTQLGKHMQEGTGLGLAISRKFVQIMGGDIRLDSAVGQGTTFSFEIPIKVLERPQEDVSREYRSVIALTPDQPSYRLLVVDDHRESRQVLIKLLAAPGFNVREARNGQEALEIWQSWSPDLIWMNLRMPDLDGYEVTQTIRAEESRMTLEKPCKIVVLTAGSFEEERQVALAKGCDDFLRKPFRQEEVFDALRKHLGAQFVYAEESSSHSATTKKVSQNELKLQVSAPLSSEFITQLHYAALIADISQLLRLIQDIRASNPGIADVLTPLAENYDYTRILEFLEQLQQA